MVFCAIAVAGLLLYILISVLRHIHFESTGFDLAIFDQAIRFYSHFQAPASSFRGYANLLGDHFHPILVVLAPLYWISDSPINLLVAQAVLVISTALPIYLYSKSKLGIWPANLLVVAFILNAALLRAVHFDFHEIAFAVPLIAWAIYFTDRQRWYWLYASLALLLLVKEDMSLLVAFFGIYLLVLRHFKHGGILLFAGLAWFFTVTKLLIPFFAGKGHSFNYWNYDQLGSDLPSAAKTALTRPLYVLEIFFTPAVKVVTLVKTFGVTLGLSLLSPIIILAIPLVLERFLSTTSNHWQFYFHYGATVAPIVILAAADSLHRISRLKPFRKKGASHARHVPVAASATLALLAVVLFAISPYTYVFEPSQYRLTSSDKAGYRMIAAVPDDASVCTTNRLAPHLGSHQLTLIGFDNPEPRLDCDYIVVAKHIDDSSLVPPTLERAGREGFDIIKTDGQWQLYRRSH